MDSSHLMAPRCDTKPGDVRADNELNAARNIERLREGHFTQHVVGTRVRVSMSSDFQVSSDVRYDNGSDDVGTNTRLRWTFSPLGELFIVYNHSVATDLAGTSRRWSFDSNQLLVKLQYVFRY